MKINKKMFIKTIDSIENQLNHDHKCCEAFNIILPSDYVSGYDNGRLYDQMIKLLQYLTNDNSDDGWIEYFIWELDFGRKYKKGCCKINGKDVNLSSSGKLYDVLKEINN